MSVAVALVADAASEGQDIVLSMLVVGLVILAVIGLGELNEWRVRNKYRP